MSSAHGGYAGIAALMGIESACIPLPSEIIMPFAGYLVYPGASACSGRRRRGLIGCNLGSVVAYWIGAKGGRPLVERYGRWVLMSHHDLDRMTEFFEKYGTDHGAAGAAAAGGAHLYRVSGGHCQDAAASLSHLHVCGFVAVVFCAGLCGHEAGRGMAHGPAFSSRLFIAFTWLWSWRWWRESSGLSGRT